MEESTEHTEAKKAINWKAVELDFRAGVKSLEQIGLENGVTKGRISQVAKRDGWTRDLKNRIKAKVVLNPEDEMSAAGFLYVIYIDTGLERLFKIGMAKHFSSRFEQHQCSSPFDICVALCYFVGNMRSEERQLHQQFDSQCVRGEWFRLTDADLDLIATRARLA